MGILLFLAGRSAGCQQTIFFSVRFGASLDGFANLSAKSFLIKPFPKRP
jgi:hypothetical protein